ncbi:MAG: hypothetical protein MAG715_01214 [Methanonatronarchaeales archaeon]|nr:hypothetical protein [Methanonatronarchaeales archaeon]MBS1264019.1 hypothetical protein [Methanonatronarchaeales archaeon]
MIVGDVLSGLYAGAVAAFPRLLAALAVLAVSYPLVLLASSSVRRGLVTAGRHEDVAGLAALLVRLFLFHSAALAVLAVLGSRRFSWHRRRLRGAGGIIMP